MTDKLVVSDAGPLIALGRCDQLDLLTPLLGPVHVPRPVLEECLAWPDLPDAKRIQTAVCAGALIAVEAQPAYIPTLDAGECPAIQYAVDHNATLLVDDRAAKTHAYAMGLRVIGTLDVLILAKRHSLIAQIRPVAERLRSKGHSLSKSALAAVLAAAGEENPGRL